MKTMDFVDNIPTIGDIDHILLTSNDSFYKTYTDLLSEPASIKLYLESKRTFTDISDEDIPILLELLKYVSCADMDEKHGGLMVHTGKDFKLQIAANCNVSITDINNAIKDFCKKRYLYRISNVSYQVNAFLFGRGAWKDILYVRKLQTSY